MHAQIPKSPRPYPNKSMNAKRTNPKTKLPGIRAFAPAAAEAANPPAATKRGAPLIPAFWRFDEGARGEEDGKPPRAPPPLLGIPKAATVPIQLFDPVKAWSDAATALLLGFSVGKICRDNVGGGRGLQVDMGEPRCSLWRIFVVV